MPVCPLADQAAALLDGEANAALLNHLAGCLDCQDALMKAAGPLAIPSPRAAGVEAPETLIDRLRALTVPTAVEQFPPGYRPDIPGYEILGELGRGGMAVVYKARDVALDRVVALKVRHPGRSDSEGTMRGLRGVRLLGSLSHPGIIRVLGIGQHEGIGYSVLEYAEGGTLAALAGRPWPAQDAARLVARLADAVRLLHQRGILHRDIKPANVLLFPRTEGRAWAADTSFPFDPKLADFDIARSIHTDTGLTTSGVAVGTPALMAPEQAAAREDVGPQADVWALGEMLYLLLTARMPSGADPVPPSRLVAGIPMALDAICLTCLHREPAKRYADAGALADALTQSLTGPPRGTPARPWWLALAAALPLLVVFGAGWLYTTSSWRASERSQGVLRMEMAERFLERGDRATATELLDGCAPAHRDERWQRLWQRSQVP